VSNPAEELYEILDALFGGLAKLLGLAPSGDDPDNAPDISRTPSRSVSVSSSSERASVSNPSLSAGPKVALPGASKLSVDPLGWLGVIVGHGNVCQSAQMKYIWNHAKYEDPTQFAPHWGINNVNTGYECPTVGVLNDYRSVPLLRYPKKAGIKACRITFSNSTLWTERFVEGPCPAFFHFKLHKNLWKDKQCQAVVRECLIRHKGKRRARHQGVDGALEKSASRLAEYPGRVTIPDYWDVNDSRRAQFWHRIREYFNFGQWLVWAAEMYRQHAGLTVPPPGWTEHCAAWGVFCAEPYRFTVKKSMLGSWAQNHGNWVMDGVKSAEVAMKGADCLPYLNAVKRHTPPPGTPGTCGEQIRPPGAPRVLLDLPTLVESFRPALDIDTVDWIAGCRSKIDNEGWSTAFGVWFGIFKAALAAASSFTGGAGGAVLQAGMSVVSSVALEFIALAPSMDGRSLSKSEIVSLAGKCLSGALDVAGAAGLSFDDAIDAAGLTAEYRQLTSLYADLRDNWGWDYASEAFGAVVEVKGAEEIEEKFH